MRFCFVLFLQRWEHRPPLTLEDFDKKMSETDAYLQILIDQVKVRASSIIGFLDLLSSLIFQNETST